MKQLKVIEILKAITENEGTHLWLDDGSGYPKSYIYEAIKELEDLQNRSCKTCKYYKPNNTTTCNGFKQDEECLRFVDSIHTIPCETFCCNKWELKLQTIHKLHIKMLKKNYMR